MYDLDKVLDQRIDLTEEQFIDYLNKSFLFRGPSKFNKFFTLDVEEDGSFIKGFFRIEKIEQNERILANSYYLFLNTGKFDIFGTLKPESTELEEVIGRLNVLNTGSLPPHFTLFVNDGYSFFIESFLSRMFTELNLKDHTMLEQIPQETYAPDEKITSQIDKNDSFEKKYKNVVLEYVNLIGRRNVSNFLEDSNALGGEYITARIFQREILPKAGERGWIRKRYPGKKSSQWIENT